MYWHLIEGDNLKKAKQFLCKPEVKSVSLALLALLIGGVFSALGSWDYKNDLHFGKKLIALVLLFIVYIGFSIMYTHTERQEQKQWEEKEADYQKRYLELQADKSKLMKKNQAYSFVMSNLISVCRQSASNVNKIIHEIIEEGKIDLRIWSFDLQCSLICEEIRKLLVQLSDRAEKEYGVCYIRLKEDEKNTVYMCAYANDMALQPTIFRKYRSISKQGKSGVYHDVALFRKNKTDIDILMNADEIQENFFFSNPKDRQKYAQYVGIPVFCDKETGGKMIGLLEIIGLHGTVISEEERVVNDIVKNYLLPYANLMLLLHKMEKALIAMPREKE